MICSLLVTVRATTEIHRLCAWVKTKAPQSPTLWALLHKDNLLQNVWAFNRDNSKNTEKQDDALLKLFRFKLPSRTPNCPLKRPSSNPSASLFLSLSQDHVFLPASSLPHLPVRPNPSPSLFIPEAHIGSVNLDTMKI